ncbi:MAG: SPW repeat protein [Planctomycetaceae bacterium]
MWSRVVEAMLGCWLIISPFIFLAPEQRTEWWFNDMIAGLAVIVFALMSYWHPTRRAHLLTLGMAGALIVLAYWHGFGDAPPISQNEMVLGVLLLMFAIVPNDAGHPPPAWERHRHAA